MQCMCMADANLVVGASLLYCHDVNDRHAVTTWAIVHAEGPLYLRKLEWRGIELRACLEVADVLCIKREIDVS